MKIKVKFLHCHGSVRSKLALILNLAILAAFFGATNVHAKHLPYDVDIMVKANIQKSENALEQQTTKVQGKVTDEAGDPMPGVNVYQKNNQQRGVITGADGTFSITVDSPDDVLVFSFIGFQTREMAIGGRDSISVTMSEEITGLGEVIITGALGFDRQKRGIGFSTDKIEGKDITEVQAPNIVTGLAGKAAGVNVMQSNGVEGGSQRIVIRGNNSITGNNQPLFIIDGIPVENNPLVDAVGNDGGVDWGTSINNINMYDVEDLNILKGPAAAALYGSRGANGVIIITTKKGGEVKPGEIGIKYSVNHRVNELVGYRDVQNEYGFGGPPGALWEIPKLYKNSEGQYYYPLAWGGDRPVYGAIPGGYNSWDLFSWYGGGSWGPRMEGQEVVWWDGEMRPYSPQPDNLKAGFKKGYTTTHNISFSGGGEKGHMRFSLTNTKNDAVVYNSDFDQTSANFGGNINLSSKLNAQVVATYTKYNRLNAPDVGGGGNAFTKGAVYSYARSWKPSVERDNYKLEDGSRNNFSGYPYSNINQYLWWGIYENNDKMVRDQLLSSIELNYTASDWLSIKARAGIDLSMTELETRNSPIDALGIKEAYYKHSLNKDYVENFDAIATFHKDGIFEGFNASFSLGGTSWRRNMYYMKGESGSVFKNPYLYTFSNYDGDIITRQVTGENRYEKEINSLYGFLNLSYKNFLFFDVTGRNDWSSTLPAKSNSYFYPSVSGSFVISEIMNMPLWFDYAKLRVAFAEAATDEEPYQVTPTYSSGSWAGKATSAMKTTLPPIDLKPQISRTMDYGFELEFLQRRLNVDFTYYKTKTENQILNSPIPWSSGMNQVKINTGSLQNQGLELSLTGVIVDGNNWRWKTTLNAARNRNKLLELGEGAEEIEIGGIWGSHNGVAMTVNVGEEYGVIKGKNYVFHENGQPIVDLFYAKGDPTQVIGAGYRASAQAEVIGNAAPKFTGGLLNMVSFKRFSLSCLIDYKWGGDIWSGDYVSALMGGQSPSTLKERNGGGLPYTYPSGETANHGVIIPGVLEDGTPNTEVVNYIWKYGRNGWSMGLFPQVDGIMENSWIKMRELVLSWSLPRPWLQKTGIVEDMSVSLVGRDLFYLYTTLPDNINPEGVNGSGNAQGLMFGAMPQQRSLGFSVNVSF